MATAAPPRTADQLLAVPALRACERDRYGRGPHIAESDPLEIAVPFPFVHRCFAQSHSMKCRVARANFRKTIEALAT